MKKINPKHKAIELPDLVNERYGDVTPITSLRRFTCRPREVR
jgi:hypothetical protein